MRDSVELMFDGSDRFGFGAGTTFALINYCPKLHLLIIFWILF